MITTTVTGKVKTSGGEVVENAEIIAKLNAFDYDEDFGYITDRRISTTTDANGDFSFELWPNTRGTEGTIYRIVIKSPVPNISTTFTATIPEVSEIELNDAADFDPVPPKSDAELLVLDAKEQVEYAKEWANKDEDSLISTDAGGDGVDDFSALHHAAKASDSETAAATSESNAAASESAAATSESNAATSESNAATSETNAANSATAAANSATVASNAETVAVSAKDDAVAAKNATENIFDTFDDRFLGSFANDPTVDNDGNPLVAGAVYYNTTQQEVYFYNGATWDAPAAQAETSATNALASENAAATSEQNAASSASAASTSETNAEDSATAAATSESNAATSENNALASENAAATSESNAATSETNAANSASAAATSESNALTSEQNADTSESNALTSEQNAATSEQNASDSADAAATSEQNAANSETAAQTAATDAETALDNFTDQYLGVKSSDPSTDNDGDPLLEGAIYYNSTDGQLRIYDGSAWQDAAFSAEGTVLSFNGRDGVVSLTSADVTDALTYTPYDASNPDGYISDYTVTSGDVTSALGYTPQDESTAYDSADFDTDFSNKTTTGLSEGTNLYYTDARARGALSASGDLTYSQATGEFSFTERTDAEIRSLFSSGGDLSYDSNTGEFSVTIPDVEVDLVRAPQISSPSDGAQDTSVSLTIEGTAFAPIYSVDEREYRQVQIIEAGGSFASPIVDEQISTDDYNFAGDPDTDYQSRIRDKIVGSAFSAWSDVVSFNTVNIFVDQPTITSPSDGATDIPEQPVIESSAFNVVNGSDTHVASQWVITRVSDSTVVFDSGEDTSNLESIEVPAGVLDEGEENYTVKVRHKGSTYGFSAYSPEITFTTSDVFFDYTDPANIGAPTDGGFLAGVVVSDVDSQTYAIIVSDGDGDTDRTGAGSKQWRTSNSGLSQAQTLSDGKSVMDYIVNNETLSDFPAFEWIQTTLNDTNYNGYNDWYLPARDELELVYRHFKPTTGDNNDGTRASGSEFGADGATHGTNNSSDPNYPGYTTTDPSQTTVTSFQDGGADYLTDYLDWSSTEYDASLSWFQAFGNGFQNFSDKDIAFRVRAVRRIAV